MENPDGTGEGAEVDARNQLDGAKVSRYRNSGDTGGGSPEEEHHLFVTSQLKTEAQYRNEKEQANKIQNKQRAHILNMLTWFVLGWSWFMLAVALLYLIFTWESPYWARLVPERAVLVVFIVALGAMTCLLCAVRKTAEGGVIMYSLAILFNGIVIGISLDVNLRQLLILSNSDSPAG